MASLIPARPVDATAPFSTFGEALVVARSQAMRVLFSPRFWQTKWRVAILAMATFAALC